MKNEDLKNFLLQTISRLKDNGQVEVEKLELKKKWYNLKSKTDEYEFLKDIVALANTPGLEGYLIIGIDEKSGEVHNSLFKDSGLRDIVDLHNLLIKSVDRPFDFKFEEVELFVQNVTKTLSILTIPPSINKPHVIKYYKSKKEKEIQNYIPIRKLTGVFPANRSDIDFMYYDRKNIEPDYAVEIKAYNPIIHFNSFTQGPFKANLQVCFQNNGRKPVAIVRSQLIIYPIPEQGIKYVKLLYFSGHTVKHFLSLLQEVSTCQKRKAGASTLKSLNWKQSNSRNPEEEMLRKLPGILVLNLTC